MVLKRGPARMAQTRRMGMQNERANYPSAEVFALPLRVAQAHRGFAQDDFPSYPEIFRLTNNGVLCRARMALGNSRQNGDRTRVHQIG